MNFTGEFLYRVIEELRVTVFFLQMNEGRKSQVVLPDERRLDLLIQVSHITYRP